MKLFLLKIIFQRRARDEGFTLPMVIALGLVMVLLGAVNIVKSSEENLNAIALNSSSDALAIAEVGVTKYRELLNQNRILTVYNHDQWTGNNVPVDYLGNGVIRNIDVVGQTCDNIANTPTGWLDDDTTPPAPNDTSQWWEIKENIDGTAGDETIGEYRLVSYTYDIDDDLTTNNNGQFSPKDDTQNDNDSFVFNNTAGTTYNTRGILTVQGRSPDGSEAQIEVEIPLRINDLESFAPVLWVGSGAIASPGSLNLSNPNDNIILKSANAGCPPPGAIAGNSNVINDARDIPSIQTILDTITTASGVSQTNDTYNSGDYFGSTSDTAYITGITGDDCETASNYCYLYNLGSLNITADAENDGVSDVILYVNGNVDITASSSPLNIGSTGASSDYFELYVDNGNPININTNGNTVNITGFIHAPTSTLTISGGGTVNINGAVWVDEWNANGVTVNIASDQTEISAGNSEPSYKFYATNEIRTPRPVTSSPTNWVTEEVE